LTDAIPNLDDLDEVTLALMPDLHYQWKDGNSQAGIDGVTGYKPLASALIQKCAELKDKFAILDYYQPTSSQTDMRNWVNPVPTDLKYGSLYYPWLKTTQQHSISADQLTLSPTTGSNEELALSTINDDLDNLEAASIYDTLYDINSLKADYATNSNDITNKAKLTSLFSFLNKLTGVLDSRLTLTDGTVDNYRVGLSSNVNYIENVKHLLWFTEKLEVGNLINPVTAVNKPNDTWIDDAFATVYNTLAALEGDSNSIGYTVPTTGNTAAKNAAVLDDLNSGQYVDLNVIFSAIAGLFETAYARKQMIEGQLFTEDPIYKQAKTAVENFLKQMPSQGAVTGVYCKNDRERGVWKSPANIPVQAIEKPLVEVSNAEQDGLNYDAGTGKSINVIRTFAGKGALVWGARTLDGNSNEWRYISVRRFFNFAEESIKKAMHDFVFEPNNARTWVKIKAMITSFLVEQWKAGALLGASFDEAFFVRVGEDTTSEQEILDGIINVQIGLAVARPAEFIILEFSHYTKS
jgi:hypothetical protein